MRLRQKALFFLPLLALFFASVLPAGNEQTLTGRFRWTQAGEEGDLRAVFTPKGENSYDVSFHFDYRGEHTYTGTAEGSLKEGGLKGTVQDEYKRRRWDFEGTFHAGKFQGNHVELRDGDRQATGTLTLGP